MRARLLVVLCALLLAAVPASAVSISITTDRETYEVENFIQIHVRVDPEGAWAQGVSTRLIWDGALVDLKQIDRSPPGAGWGSFALCDQQDGFADLWLYDAIGTDDERPVPGPLTADLWLWTTAPGPLAFEIENYGGYHSLTNSLDGYTKSVQIVPEPGTAMLLAVGLIGMARRRRPR